MRGGRRCNHGDLPTAVSSIQGEQDPGCEDDLVVNTEPRAVGYSPAVGAFGLQAEVNQEISLKTRAQLYRVNTRR